MSLSFLGSLFLWGLPLVAVPVVIHLLSRRRRDVVRWGAMQFLIEATTRRRRLWRVDDLLLMLLRAVAVALFVLALAQPLLKSRWFGTSGIRDVILVVDTSLSTSRQAGDATRFERVLEQADELIDDLRGGDYLRVCVASTGPEWLAPIAIPIDANTKREVRSRLHELTPTLAAADMVRCVQAAADAEPADEQATRVITVLTDDQAYGWRAEAAPAWRGIRETISGLAAGAAINVVSVGEPDPLAANLSVESVEASRTVTAAGDTLVLTAAIKNTAQRSTDATMLSWAAGETSIGVTSLPVLGPDEQTQVEIAHAFEAPGVYAVSCRIDAPDALVMDNTGRLVVEVVETLPILVVDGSPRADPLETQTAYFLAALGHAPSDEAPEWRSVFRPTVVEVGELGTTRLADFHCVVLANVPALSPEVVEELAAYVRRGGGLWIALGDQTDPALFNERLFREGSGLSPLALDEPVGDAGNREQHVAIHPPTTHHPATRLLADTERLDLDRARIFRRHQFVRSDDDRDVAVLLATAEASALAVEHVVDRGRIIVQAVPLGVRWSNLPSCQAFVVLAHEWLWHLVQPSATQWNAEPGDTLAASFMAERFQEGALMTRPSGAAVAVSARLRGSRHDYRHSTTLEPGTYRLTLKDASGEAHDFPFHVRRDANESDLSARTDPQTEMLTAAAGMQFVADPLADAPGTVAEARSKPAWAWLLAGLAVLMLGELALAGVMSRRRQGKSPPLTMDAGWGSAEVA